MDIKETYLDDLAFNVKGWNKEVKSHKKQLKKFEKKLGEVSQRNNALEVKQGLESFQNRIIVEREVMDNLSHKLKQKRNEILNADKSLELDGTIKRSLSPLRDEMKVFTKLNSELQHEMTDFFLEWL